MNRLPLYLEFNKTEYSLRTANSMKCQNDVNYKYFKINVNSETNILRQENYKKTNLNINEY